MGDATESGFGNPANKAGHIVLSVAACLMLAACESLLFYPESQLAGDPGRLGLSYRELSIDTTDGLALHGWFLPAEPDPTTTWSPKRIWIFFR